MKKVLLTSKKAFYKGNMHCHSTLSDGKMTPEELKEFYKAKGYSFLAITDHEHINNNSYLDDESFITITSGEFAIKEFPEQSTMKNQKMRVCHLNFYAKKQDNDLSVCYNSVYDHFSKGERRQKIKKLQDEYERIYSADGINDMIRLANENGFFVAYNHPRWSLENYSHYSHYEGLWGVEIMNHACQESGIFEYDINVHDDFLRDGKKIFVTCGDDNHQKHTCAHAFVMVNTDKGLNYDAIINALLCGDFYVSHGPTIEELYIEDNRVYIKCSGAVQIGFSTVGRAHGAVRAEEGELITEASFELKPEYEYFRISVTDARGRRADTQAYFI